MNRSLKLFTKPKRNYPESRLQKAVVQYLRLSGTRDILFLKITNEGKRSKFQGAEFKLQGMVPGAADLLMVREGRAYFLELKAPGEKPTDAQMGFAVIAATAGAHYAWADSLNQAITILKDWGLLKRLARAA